MTLFSTLWVFNGNWGSFHFWPMECTIVIYIDWINDRYYKIYFMMFNNIMCGYFAIESHIHLKKSHPLLSVRKVDNEIVVMRKKSLFLKCFPWYPLLIPPVNCPWIMFSPVFLSAIPVPTLPTTPPPPSSLPRSLASLAIPYKHMWGKGWNCFYRNIYGYIDLMSNILVNASKTHHMNSV